MLNDRLSLAVTYASAALVLQILVLLAGAHPSEMKPPTIVP
jgi:hypothetical protein